MVPKKIGVIAVGAGFLDLVDDAPPSLPPSPSKAKPRTPTPSTSGSEEDIVSSRSSDVKREGSSSSDDESSAEEHSQKRDGIDGDEVVAMAPKKLGVIAAGAGACCARRHGTWRVPFFWPIYHRSYIFIKFTRGFGEHSLRKKRLSQVVPVS